MHRAERVLPGKAIDVGDKGQWPAPEWYQALSDVMLETAGHVNSWVRHSPEEIKALYDPVGALRSVKLTRT